MTIGANYHYVRKAIISEAQAFTTSWADIGSEISMAGYNSMGIWINLDINAGSNARIRALAKLDAGGAAEYIIPIKNVGASVITLEDEYYEFNDDSDNLFLLEISTSGLIPFVQLQIQVGTDGGADSQVDALEVTQNWK